MRRFGTTRVVLAIGFAMVVAAVALQAQQVAGQQAVEELIASRSDAAVQGAELRAAVASGESPANILDAAEELGMVQPAAVVAVPAAGGTVSRSDLPPDGAPGDGMSRNGIAGEGMAPTDAADSR